MTWRIEFDSDVEHDLSKLDVAVRKRILNYIKIRLASTSNPMQHGKPLKGKRSGIWRYRVGNYRILCDVYHKDKLIVVLSVGHRKDVYK